MSTTSSTRGKRTRTALLIGASTALVGAGALQLAHTQETKTIEAQPNVVMTQEQVGSTGSSDSIISSLIGSLVPSSPVQPQAPTGDVTVSQGDPIYIETGKTTQSGGIVLDTCTAGYINKQTRDLALAGHCIDTEVMPSGHKVYTSSMKQIGVAYKDAGDRDTGRVHLIDSVTIGDNKFSGDNIDRVIDMNERLCTYGAKTRQVLCGNVTRVSPNGEFEFGDGHMGQKGDSGGPVWSDQGFVGTYSGGQFYENTGIGAGGYGYTYQP